MARAHHQYSSELKQRLVEEIETGHLSIRGAARDAQTTVAMVQVWRREYGRFQPKRDIVEVVMKSEQDRIAALEKALATHILALNQDAFSAAFRQSPMKREKLRGLQRNASVASTNLGP